MSLKPTMNGPQKSDGLVVPTKPSNKAANAAAETVEGRSPAKGNTDQQNASRTQSRKVGAPSALDRVREAANKDKGRKFTTLQHHVTEERLRSAFFELKKKAAPGIDGVTWDSYSEQLDERIADLHGRVHRGAYRARPSRRVFIAKADGTATSAWHRLAGRQGRPACCRRRDERDLRKGFSRILVRLPGRAQPARCAGCSRDRTPAEEGRAVLGGASRKNAQVFARAAPREDPSDCVWSLRGCATSGTEASRCSGDLRLPRIHAHWRANPGGEVSPRAADRAKADERNASTRPRRVDA